MTGEEHSLSEAETSPGGSGVGRSHSGLLFKTEDDDRLRLGIREAIIEVVDGCDWTLVPRPARRRHKTVKKPMNAFLVWSQAARRKLADKYPPQVHKFNKTQLAKALGKLWRLLKEADKRPFIQEAECLRKLYKSYPHKSQRPRGKKRELGAASEMDSQGEDGADHAPSHHETLHLAHGCHGGGGAESRSGESSLDMMSDIEPFDLNELEQYLSPSLEQQPLSPITSLVSSSLWSESVGESHYADISYSVADSYMPGWSRSQSMAGNYDADSSYFSDSSMLGSHYADSYVTSTPLNLPHSVTL